MADLQHGRQRKFPGPNHSLCGWVQCTKVLLLTMFDMLPVALTLLKDRPSAAARVAEPSLAKNDRSPAALPNPGIKPTKASGCALFRIDLRDI